ncbi:2-C-methyl-D-erythritol 4-phosphate cytidylyltransferase [bacterium]|nr:2-C-methyl-D-erythritol 4-phosphate cytidylyltransferase [bacterium]
MAIVAAGKGVRFGEAVPKQFLTLGDRPVFAHSLRLFDQLPFVNEIVLVVPCDGGLPANCRKWIDELARPAQCVAGGTRRQESVANGLAAMRAGYEVALVHDAARPFPDPEAIAQLARAAADCGGGLLAARSPDTVKRSNADGRVAETLDRDTIWLAQTPQAIRADLVPRAILELNRPEIDVTDEAALLERWGVPVALVESSIHNFKITRAEDLAYAESILK